MESYGPPARIIRGRLCADVDGASATGLDAERDRARVTQEGNTQRHG